MLLVIWLSEYRWDTCNHSGSVCYSEQVMTFVAAVPSVLRVLLYACTAVRVYECVYRCVHVGLYCCHLDRFSRCLTMVGPRVLIPGSDLLDYDRSQSIRNFWHSVTLWRTFCPVEQISGQYTDTHTHTHTHTEATHTHTHTHTHTRATICSREREREMARNLWITKSLLDPAGLHK